jgi:hypothetical protein
VSIALLEDLFFQCMDVFVCLSVNLDIVTAIEIAVLDFLNRVIIIQIALLRGRLGRVNGISPLSLSTPVYRDQI